MFDSGPTERSVKLRVEAVSAQLAKEPSPEWMGASATLVELEPHKLLVTRASLLLLLVARSY